MNPSFVVFCVILVALAIIRGAIVNTQTVIYDGFLLLLTGFIGMSAMRHTPK